MTLSRLLIAIALVASSAASCSGDDTAIAVDPDFADVVIDDPTILMRQPMRLFEDIGREPSAVHADYSIEEIEASLVEAFESDDGKRLYVLKEALIPALVIAGVDATNGADPEVIASPFWLGQIDGFIERALYTAEWEALTEMPDPPPESMIREIITPGLVPAVASAVGIDPSEVDVNAIVSTVQYIHNAGEADLDLSYAERIEAENNFSHRAEWISIYSALERSGHLEIPEGENPFSMAVNGIDNSDYPILDSAGEPIVVDGMPVDVGDWDSEFAPFSRGHVLIDEDEALDG